jgi:uncharacterized delta-60 repeat protein
LKEEKMKRPLNRTGVVKIWLSFGIAVALALSGITAALAVDYLDPTYGSPNGYVTLDGLSAGSALQSDDRMLVLNNGHLTRLLADGSVDASFGTDGVADPVFSEYAVFAVAPDEAIIVVDVCMARDVILTRLLSDGQLDPAFHSTCQSIQAEYWVFSIIDVVVQADGRILVGAFDLYMGDAFFGYSILARFEADGDLDVSFTNDGVLLFYPPSPPGGSTFSLVDMALQPDGAILLAGTVTNLHWPGQYPTYIVVVRLTSSGQYDSTFSEDGVFVYDYSDEAEFVYKIALQQNSHILVAGIETVSAVDIPIVLGLTPGGTLDSGFGDLGKISIPEKVKSLLVLLDDGFLTGGSEAGANDIVIRKFMENGDMDPSFGGSGSISFDTFGSIRAFHMQHNGQVLFTSASSSNQTFVARLGMDLTPHVTFEDVSYAYWARPWIESLYRAGVTGGCGTTPLLFCPADGITRAEMAVFLLRAKYGSSYSPSPATGGVFDDVPSTHWAAAWIEDLANEGITGGCGGDKYCPGAVITRAQMAVLLLRAKHGPAYTPPAALGLFADVPTDYWAAAWIEQLAAEGITGGCGGGDYCPETVVTRAQMAVFLVTAFGLP